VSIRIDVDKSQLTHYLKAVAARRAWAFSLFRDVGAELVAEEMRRQAPRRTGRLANSIQARDVPRGFAVVPTVDYAVFVEYGTRPHVILPRRARALRFEVNGDIVYCTRVHHPGTAPNPFVGRTAEWAAEELPRLAAEIVGAWVHGGL